MKYYRKKVVQTGSKAIIRCDRAEVGRRWNANSVPMGALAVRGSWLEQLGDPLLGEPENAPRITHRQVSGSN